MSAIYDLGPFRLHVEKKTLAKSGAPLALGAHAVGVLAALVERAPGLVSKAALLDAVWPNVVVEEGNISTQVYTIRRALAQVPGGDRWIETLSGRGYRYVGPVARLTSGDHAESRSRLSNLAEPLTSFIGRERELVELKRLLATKRLITIVGPGGIGKTRLALRAASEVIDAYRDGAWLAELASTRDADLVPAVVAQVFGVAEKSGTPITKSLRSFFKSRQLLLVLDNCEHVIESSANLVDELLREAQGATIIATSREPLRVVGEQIYTLQPLSLPNPQADVEAFRASEAVQLLIDRIQLQIHDFSLTPARVASIGALSAHLDGIPLALELAAARIHSLSIDEINARVAERFSLLTIGPRTVLPRQQTLRATFDWSYELLSESEQTAFQRFTVFPASFSEEAAVAVASDDRFDAEAIADALAQLAAQSLVSVDAQSAAMRYRMLETIRTYAAEKLPERESRGPLARRHAEYFRDIFERSEDDRQRMPDAQWHATYVLHLDDVRTALDWALASDDDSTVGVALAAASGPLWITLSLYGEGAKRLEAAAARIDANTPEHVQARLWLWFGALIRRANPARGLAAFERSVDLYRKLDLPVDFGHASALLARVLTLSRRFEEAEALLAEALPKLENCGVPKLLGLYQGSVATLNALTGDPQGARMHFQAAVSLYREAGSETSALESMSNLADISWSLGDLAGAEASLREYIAMRGTPYVRRAGLGIALGSLAGVLTERGRLSEAREAAAEALPLLAEAGNVRSFIDHFALRAALAGHEREAARLAAFADAAYTAQHATRLPNEARARERLQSLLDAAFDRPELDRLLDEGTRMDEQAAYRSAVEE